MTSGMNWIRVVQFGENWRAAVDTVMNIFGSIELGNYWNG